MEPFWVLGLEQQPKASGVTEPSGRALGGRERLGRRLLGDVEITEPPGQGGYHPAHSSWCTRVTASSTSLTGTAPPSTPRKAVQRCGSDLRASCTALHCPQRGGGRRDGLDWWAAKGPRRPPGPGAPRTLPARPSPWLSSAPAQDDVEEPATDSTPGLDPRARPRGDLDNFGGCGHLDHLSYHRNASLAPVLSGCGTASRDFAETPAPASTGSS